MSVSYHLDRDVLWITAEGDYPSGAFLETVAEGLADPASTTPTFLLCDVSASDSLVDRSIDEVRNSADYYGSLLGRVAGLAIVAERLVDYGLMRMLASMAQIRGCNVEVFRDTDAALAWLETLERPSDRRGNRRRGALG